MFLKHFVLQIISDCKRITRSGAELEPLRRKGTLTQKLKGHSARIKCMQRFISLSGLKSKFFHPSEIVFLPRSCFSKGRYGVKHWTDFNFNTLLVLCFVVGEQRLQIFVIARRLVVGEHCWVCCVSLLDLSLKILLSLKFLRFEFIDVSTIDYDQEK